MRAYIVDIISSKINERESSQRIIEIERLVTTYGGLVIVKTIQRKDEPSYRTYVGSGKLDEIIEDMIATQSDLLIVGNILKPSQIYNINKVINAHPYIKDKQLQIEAWDKVDLILKIFQKHATGVEAKLQIELAAIKHMGPRIFGMGMELSRQGGSASGGGGGASRGLGETNTERMRRHLQDKTISIQKQLEQYAKMRDLHRKHRKRSGLASVGIVGYTNAGKSSLLRALCKKDAYIADKLFATLGTEVAKLYIPILKEGVYSGQEVLIIDTIGFIRDLPPQLIQAFASTLEDSIQSDILLHVVDASDPERQHKIDIVSDILLQIQATQPVIYVFNKCDQIDDDRKLQISSAYQDKYYCFVSAIDNRGLSQLKNIILNKIMSIS